MIKTPLNVTLTVEHGDLDDADLALLVRSTLEGVVLLHRTGPGEVGAAIEEVLSVRVEHALPDPSASRLGPFVRESETSRKAALDAYPRQGSQRARILRALRLAPGEQTREELAIRLGLSENTVRPRVKELIEGGWIRETGRTRKTTRGSDAVLLALTDRALAEHRERGL